MKVQPSSELSDEEACAPPALTGTDSANAHQLAGEKRTAGDDAGGMRSEGGVGGATRNLDSDPDILFLSAQDVSFLFTSSVAIESQRMAFTALGEGSAVLPEKLTLNNPVDGSMALCYLARLSPETGAVSKFVSVNPRNAGSGLPSVSAVIVVLDAVTGQPAAIMDGTIITTRRTAAASAVAVDALAAAEAPDLAVLGCGVQGREHVRMISRVRTLRTVRLWAPSESRRQATADELTAETGLAVHACSTAREAVAGAQVVALCTLSSVPVVEASWLAPGVTVVSIGSFEPGRCEVGADVVRASARVVVDDPATSAGHAGPIVNALQNGVLSRENLVGLGDVLVGKERGRSRDDDLVYYNSTGIGVQDAAAATAVLSRARLLHIGRRLSLTASSEPLTVDRHV